MATTREDTLVDPFSVDLDPSEFPLRVEEVLEEEATAARLGLMLLRKDREAAMAKRNKERKQANRPHPPEETEEAPEVVDITEESEQETGKQEEDRGTGNSPAPVCQQCGNPSERLNTLVNTRCGIRIHRRCLREHRTGCGACQ